MKTDSIPTRHRENDARRRFDPTHSETDLRQMDVSSISGLTEAQKAEIAKNPRAMKAIIEAENAAASDFKLKRGVIMNDGTSDELPQPNPGKLREGRPRRIK